MRAVGVDASQGFEVREITDLTPGSNDVVLKVSARGICGADVHVILGECPPNLYPIVISHEFGGEVVASGSEVTEVKVGDRVGVDPTLNRSD